jgi:hypothetical protein
MLLWKTKFRYRVFGHYPDQFSPHHTFTCFFSKKFLLKSSSRLKNTAGINFKGNTVAENWKFCRCRAFFKNNKKYK